MSCKAFRLLSFMGVGLLFSQKFRAVVSNVRLDLLSFQVWTVLLQWALLFFMGCGLWSFDVFRARLLEILFFFQKKKKLREGSCLTGLVCVFNSCSKFHFLHCCGSGNSQTCVLFYPFFLCKEALLVFSTTCASVPVEDWASRPSLRSAAGTGWNSAGIGRNWPDSDGTCHHQRAGQSPSARTRDRYFCVRRLRKKPRSNNSPDSTQLPVPPCPGRARFLFRPIPLCGPLPRWPDCASKNFFTAMSISRVNPLHERLSTFSPRGSKPTQICSHGTRIGQCEQKEDTGTRPNVAAVCRYSFSTFHKANCNCLARKQQNWVPRIVDLGARKNARMRECVNYWVTCVRCVNCENCKDCENSGFVRLALAQAQKMALPTIWVISSWHMPKVLTRKKCVPRLLKRQNFGFVRLAFAQAERQQARQKKNIKLWKQRKYKDFSEI